MDGIVPVSWEFVIQRVSGNSKSEYSVSLKYGDCFVISVIFAYQVTTGFQSIQELSQIILFQKNPVS